MSRKRKKQVHGKAPNISHASAEADVERDAEAHPNADDVLPSSGVSLKWLMAGVVALLAAVFVAVIVYYDSGAQQFSKEAAARNRIVLASDAAPSRGNVQAKVHII